LREVTETLRYWLAWIGDGGRSIGEGEEEHVLAHPAADFGECEECCFRGAVEVVFSAAIGKVSFRYSGSKLWWKGFEVEHCGVDVKEGSRQACRCGSVSVIR